MISSVVQKHTKLSSKGKIFPEPGIPESFRVLKHEFQALAIDVKMLDEDGNEVDINKEDTTETLHLFLIWLRTTL